MKTKIVIEVDTNFNKIVECDENGFPTTVDQTHKIEESFHNFIRTKLKTYLEDRLEEESICDEEFQDYSDCYVEGWDSFKDYGKIDVNVLEDES